MFFFSIGLSIRVRDGWMSPQFCSTLFQFFRPCPMTSTLSLPSPRIHSRLSNHPCCFPLSWLTSLTEIHFLLLQWGSASSISWITTLHTGNLQWIPTKTPLDYSVSSLSKTCYSWKHLAVPCPKQHWLIPREIHCEYSRKALQVHPAKCCEYHKKQVKNDQKIRCEELKWSWLDRDRRGQKLCSGRLEDCEKWLIGYISWSVDHRK